MEGISLYFHSFKALNNYLEARLFLQVHFYASSDLLMACRTMQLRFLKLGTVLTYALKNMARVKKELTNEQQAQIKAHFILIGVTAA